MAENKSTHRKKEPEAEEHENSERWLLTYADMITLLVAFFIMMYAMSVVNLKKFHDVAISIRSGFGGPFGGERGKRFSKKKLHDYDETGKWRYPDKTIRRSAAGAR